MSLSVAIVDHRFGDLDVEREILASSGATVDDCAGLGEAEALARCADADAVLVGARLRLDSSALAELDRCRVIVRYGVGVDNVDVEAATRAGIWVACVPDYCVEEVAVHAMAMILSLNRRLAGLDAAVRSGAWGIPAGAGIRRLSTRTLGVIGFGRIGEAVGRLAAGLGMTVLAHDPVRPRADVTAAGARPVDLEGLLARSDYVSLHAPPIAGRAVLDGERLARLKPGACVINLARGGLVDEPALIAGLIDGRIGGAALDVAQAEPVPADDPLLRAPNLLITPHAGWYSAESVRELRRKAAEEAARVLSGSVPLHPVNDVTQGAWA